MIKNNKQRLFEVMSRLDKTFKPKLNEGFGEIEQEKEENPFTDNFGNNEPEEEEKELSMEEKYEIIKEKLDDLYAIIHSKDNEGDENEENETPEEEHEEQETPEEEKEEHISENKPKIPVVDIAKVSK